MPSTSCGRDVLVRRGERELEDRGVRDAVLGDRRPVVAVHRPQLVDDLGELRRVDVLGHLGNRVLDRSRHGPILTYPATRPTPRWSSPSPAFGKTFSVSTRCTSGSASAHASASTHQLEVEVRRLADRGEHDAARRDPGEHEALGAQPAQQRVEVAARERADAALRHDGLARLRGERVAICTPRARLAAGHARTCPRRSAGSRPRSPARPPGTRRGRRRPGSPAARAASAASAACATTVGSRQPLDDVPLEVHQQEDGAGLGHE